MCIRIVLYDPPIIGSYFVSVHSCFMYTHKNRLYVLLDIKNLQKQFLANRVNLTKIDILA